MKLLWMNKRFQAYLLRKSSACLRRMSCRIPLNVEKRVKQNRTHLLEHDNCAPYICTSSVPVKLLITLSILSIHCDINNIFRYLFEVKIVFWYELIVNDIARGHVVCERMRSFSEAEHERSIDLKIISRMIPHVDCEYDNH